MAAFGCAALCLLVLAGCESPPGTKTVAASPRTKLTYWEYKELAGVDVETSPEAQQLLHDGWTFSGYSLPYPNENYRVEFPAGQPIVMGSPGHYFSVTNSLKTVAHFRRIVKVVDVK